MSRANLLALAAGASIRIAAPTARDRRRLETRNRLFDAAIAEYTRVGVAEADVGRIVRNAGVAWGTFFFHFPTKNHVLAELGDRHEANIVRRLTLRSGRKRSLAAFLNALLEALRTEQDAVGSGSLVREMLLMYVSRPDEEISNAGLLGVVTRYFSAAAARGQVRRDITAEELAKTLLTIVFGFLLRSSVPLRERQDELRRMVDVFERGVRT